MLQLVRKHLARRRMRVLRAMRRLKRREDGSAAIEFGFVAFPFLALVFAILETAIVFFASQSLETAVADSGRLIMTGQAQTQGFDKAAFKNSVCARIFALFDCQAGLIVDVKTYPNFPSIDYSLPLDASGNFQDNTVYQPGNPSDIVVVRLFYQWPIYVAKLQNMDGKKRLLAATLAFRNEPFAAPPPSPPPPGP